MRWPPWSRQADETQGDDVDRFDDVLDDDERDPADGEGEDEEDEAPEFDDAQRAYLEREAEKRVAAAQATAGEALEAERARHRAELVELARTSGTAAQPRQPQQPAAVDPFEALGERPDPSYEADEAREWDKRYREAMKLSVLQELQPHFQALQQRQATSAVDVAVARTRAVLEEEGLNWAEVDGFEPAVRDLLLTQDMSTWDQPEFLLAVAGSVKRKLKAGKIEPRTPDRARERDGRARAEAQRGALDQIGMPRDIGRAAPDTSDPTERRKAEMSGMTLAEWRASQDITGAEIRRERERKKARAR